MEYEHSIIRQLTSKVNGLTLITSRANFNTKLMVVNGLIISKLSYLIQLWGGCEGYLLKMLQVQLNRAARSVTGLSGFTSTRKLMDMCGWLTVKQLITFQTILMVHKTLLTKQPFYVYSRLPTDQPYMTRQLSTGCIRLDHTFRHKGDLPRSSFRQMGAHQYNSLLLKT